MAKGLLVQVPDQIRDLQDRVTQAEEARRAAEARYRWLFDRNLAGVYVAALDGRILEVNLACSHMFGYGSPAEARSHTLQETVASLKDFQKFVRNLRKLKFINNMETQLRRPDGPLLWVRLNASLIESNQDPREVIEGTLIDITTWKRTEEELRLSETRFRNLVERSSDAISLVDASGNVLYSSHAVSPIFGYQIEERIGKSVFELIHSGDIQQVLPLFKKLVQSPFSSVTTQMRYRHKNGSWRWIEALGTNLLEDPSVQAVVINYHDITEHLQLQEQLYQAQKMEAVGRLAGGVAHDFNNLLTAILGYSDMILEKLSQTSVLRRYTMEIKKAGDRAASLTRQLLAFSRLQVLSPQVLDLNTVISEMDKILARVIGEDIRLVTIPEASLCRVKADPAQIEQVIINLAVNARDAMPEGGELTIKTSNVEIEEGFTAESVKVTPGSYVLLEVSDTGCGMNQETRARAFEPFFTTKEKGKGTGLGLAMVYGVVKQSGGYIWVFSQPGNGASFRIYLPSVEEAPDASPRQRDVLPAREYQGNETILLVEDENAVRELVRSALRSKGYTVLEATQGVEALALCQAYQSTIDLMLTDVVMPQMKGQELAQRIRAFHPETQVLFMTGYAGNQIGNAEVLGANAQFILKPFSADALGQKIRSLLDHR